MQTLKDISLGSLNKANFEPMMVSDDVSVGELSWIKENYVHFWRGTADSCPQTVDYPIAREETVYVLEGSVEIELEDGSVHNLTPGDVATFRKGSHTRWSFTFPFVKLAIFGD